MMAGSEKLWELDSENGILHFNIRHPDWVECDKSDRRICQLQETIAIQALALELMPLETRELVRMFIDHTTSPLVSTFHESVSFNPLRKVAK